MISTLVLTIFFFFFFLPVIHKSSAATGGDKYLEVDSATMVDEVEEHGHEYTEHSFADELPHRNSKEEIKNLWQKSRKFISKIARLELENRRLSTNLGQMGANLSKGERRHDLCSHCIYFLPECSSLISSFFMMIDGTNR